MRSGLSLRRLCQRLLKVARMDTSPHRIYKTFVHKEAVVRICCRQYDIVTAEIIRQRCLLEEYICKYPQFQRSLVPVSVDSDGPEIAKRMAAAADHAGVGPMAAVAGAMSLMAAQAALKAGADEVIVDNGGDIFLKLSAPAVIGVYSGPEAKLNKLAFQLTPEDTPLSICASSGRMGHSMSLGLCDLAITVAGDAALADAAATLAANLVKTADDVEAALDKVMEVEGLDGVMIIKSGRVGMAGKLPPLVKTQTAPNPFYA